MSSGCEKDILRFETIPNRGLFEASCVQRNFPAVLRGANVHWPALDKWNPVNGGLEYLKGLAGDAKVQAMASSQGSTFYGAIGRHERIEAQFKDILNLASNTLGNGTNESSRMLDMEKESAAHPVSSQDGEGSHSTSNETELREGLNIYLAQAPILNRGEANASASLHKLLQDLSIPNCIDEEIVASMNLWMSVTGSRSSTHYDPFHNLLCPIVGSRRVTLWPPSSTPYLYPLALHGEASNHSAVDFAAPNYVQFPLFCEAEKTSFCVTILPGDALFIPEGWWHQVDADSVALAVNIWWPSLTSTTFGSHMDAYYARRIILRWVLLAMLLHEASCIRFEAQVQRRSTFRKGIWKKGR